MRTIALVSVIAALGLSAVGASPQQIVYARVSPNPGGLESVHRRRRRQRRATRCSPSADLDYDPRSRQTEQSIVFTSERAGSADLFRVKRTAPRSSGSPTIRPTTTRRRSRPTAGSSSSSARAKAATRASGRWTSAPRRAKALTSGTGGDFRPSWSPDGAWIAFASGRGSDLPFAYGRWERLQLVGPLRRAPDGSGLKRVSEHGEFCGSPKWSRDSRRVVAYCMTAEQTLVEPARDTRSRDPMAPTRGSSRSTSRRARPTC